MIWKAVRWSTLAIAVGALAGAAGYYLFGQPDSEDRAQAPVTTLATLSVPTTTPTPPPTTAPTTTPTPTASPRCEDGTTQYNADASGDESLLPDCGQSPAPAQASLSLACGGDYPVILYKSTTSGGKASICGKDNVGDKFRVVVQPKGQAAQDLKGEYAWQEDAWVATAGDTTWTLNAVDGSLVAERAGKTTSYPSSDWTSLDIETDDG